MTAATQPAAVCEAGLGADLSGSWTWLRLARVQGPCGPGGGRRPERIAVAFRLTS